MTLDPESSGTPEPTARISARMRRWIGLAAIVALVSASTFILLLCPCDRPGGSFYSIFLVSLAGIFALAAALVLYPRLRKAPGATAFISAFKSAGFAALAVYVELRIAVLVIEWMARYRH
jgi:hypothetical protein